jgi:hypothetical protein
MLSVPDCFGQQWKGFPETTEILIWFSQSFARRIEGNCVRVTPAKEGTSVGNLCENLQSQNIVVSGEGSTANSTVVPSATDTASSLSGSALTST